MNFLISIFIFSIILKYFSTYLYSEARRIFGQKSEETIIKSGIRRKFIEMMTTIEGYFLLNSFELLDGNDQSRLDDVIMQAQLNGKI